MKSKIEPVKNIGDAYVNSRGGVMKDGKLVCSICGAPFVEQNLMISSVVVSTEYIEKPVKYGTITRIERVPVKKKKIVQRPAYPRIGKIRTCNCTKNREDKKEARDKTHFNAQNLLDFKKSNIPVKFLKHNKIEVDPKYLNYLNTSLQGEKDPEKIKDLNDLIEGHNTNINAVKILRDNLHTLLAPGIDIFFHGNPGVRKSSFGCLLLEKAAYLGKEVYYIPASEILGLKDLNTKDKIKKYEFLKTVPVLFIDELGQDQNEKFNSRLVHILNYRHSNGLITICSTNMSLEYMISVYEWTVEDDATDEEKEKGAFFSRMKTFDVIEITGHDFREDEKDDDNS